MVKKVLTLAILLVSLASVAVADEYVRGYFRKDGTYVQPHWRSSPDSNPHNNYSYPGNVNQHAGERAAGNPDTVI